MIVDEETGLSYRPDTLDRFVIREQRCYEPLPWRNGDVVMDVGANIGAFAHLAASRGAGFVKCYEPENFNFKILEANADVVRDKFKDAGVGLDQSALIDDQSVLEKGVVELFINGLKNQGTHTTAVTRGRQVQLVPVKSFRIELNFLEPEILKVDIEGGEYSLDWSWMPDSLRGVAVEYHFQRKGRQERAQSIDRQLTEDHSFSHVRAPKFGTKAWTTLAIYAR